MIDSSLHEQSETKKTGGAIAPVMLCILDGWGVREGHDDNAIANGNTPNWDRFQTQYPSTTLIASALDVGLPAGQMGNSEVGHTNLGAGRVVMQNLPLIDEAIETGVLKDNSQLQKLIDELKKSGGCCHLMGLVSPGGVHSHQNHLIALAGILNDEGINCRLHAFLDGRDTPPSTARNFMSDLLAATSAIKNFSVATVSGRYFAMDRDNNWDRVEKAYKAIVSGDGMSETSPLAMIESNYENGVTDEFMEPAVIGDYDGMEDSDAILMFNFRADRVREILAALVDPAFDGFARSQAIDFAGRLGMTEYSVELSTLMSAMFPQRPLKNILGQLVADAGKSQLRIAETEKYAHVTFFFNGGEENVFPGEERILVPSPKVATYDLKPEMSAYEVTDKLVKAIAENQFDLIIVNYANGDMVGHTGVYGAAVKAAETVDLCLGRLEEALAEKGGVMLLTADHGNAEQMQDPDSGGPHTAHTMSPVPAILVNPPPYAGAIDQGVLADVAPTLLHLMGLEQPVEMTGRSLITDEDATA